VGRSALILNIAPRERHMATMKFTILARFALVASIVSNQLSAHDLPDTEILAAAPDLVDEVASMQVILLQSPLQSHMATDHRQGNISQVKTADAMPQPHLDSPTSARGKIASIAPRGAKSVYTMSAMQDHLSNIEQVILQATKLQPLTVQFVLFVITLALTLHSALLYLPGKPPSQKLPRASGGPSTEIHAAEVRPHTTQRNAIFRCTSVNWRISSVRFGSAR